MYIPFLFCFRLVPCPLAKNTTTITIIRNTAHQNATVGIATAMGIHPNKVFLPLTTNITFNLPSILVSVIPPQTPTATTTTITIRRTDSDTVRYGNPETQTLLSQMTAAQPGCRILKSTMNRTKGKKLYTAC